MRWKKVMIWRKMSQVLCSHRTGNGEEEVPRNPVNAERRFTSRQEPRHRIPLLLRDSILSYGIR